MKKLRVYLDTSVINFLFADDAPEKKRATIEFFDRTTLQGLPIYISQVVLDEIGRTKDIHRRDHLLDAIRVQNVSILAAEPINEVESLARAYIQKGAIPVRAIDDALHVAICTVNNIDVLASWNFKHLANVNRERKICAVNESLGYVYPLRIASPEEVTGDS